jgi:methyl-accepting chemotaxis protein
MSDWSIGKKITSALAVCLLGLVVVATLAYSNISKLTKTSQWVNHTHQVLEAREQILASLKDAETGQRGFIITGEPRYLEPYNNAVAKLPQEIAHLRELTIDNGAQQQRISELEPLIADKLAELKQTIDLRSNSGFEAAQKVVLTDAGKAVMDQIRGKAGEIENAERTLLQVRETDAANSVQTTKLSLVITALLAMLIGGFLGFNLIRSLSSRLGEAVDALADRWWRPDSLA